MTWSQCHSDPLRPAAEGGHPMPILQSLPEKPHLFSMQWPCLGGWMMYPSWPPASGRRVPIGSVGRRSDRQVWCSGPHKCTEDFSSRPLSDSKPVFTDQQGGRAGLWDKLPQPLPCPKTGALLLDTCPFVLCLDTTTTPPHPETEELTLSPSGAPQGPHSTIATHPLTSL